MKPGNCIHDFGNKLQNVLVLQLDLDNKRVKSDYKSITPWLFTVEFLNTES